MLQNDFARRCLLRTLGVSLAAIMVTAGATPIHEALGEITAIAVNTPDSDEVLLDESGEEASDEGVDPAEALSEDIGQLLACAEEDVECKIALGEIPLTSTREDPGPLRTYHLGTAVVFLTDWEAERQRRCIALTAYGEARGASPMGIFAVMWIIMNRAVMNNEVKVMPCDVVAKRAAFEALARKSLRGQRWQIRKGDMPSWPRIRNVVDRHKMALIRTLTYHMLNGKVLLDPTAGATHYFAPEAQQRLGRQVPFWAEKMQQTAAIDGHVFFRE